MPDHIAGLGVLVRPVRDPLAVLLHPHPSSSVAPLPLHTRRRLAGQRPHPPGSPLHIRSGPGVRRGLPVPDPLRARHRSSMATPGCHPDSNHPDTRHDHSRHSKPLTLADSCVGSATIDHGTWNGRSVRQGVSPGNPLEAWTLPGDYLVFALPPRPGWRVSAMGGHDSSVIRRLARMVPAPPGKPVREEAAQGQRRARRLAERPGTWDRHQAAIMMAGFDAAAAGWDAGRGAYRRPVLADAVERGGPFRPGRAVEIASGTGLLMPLIRQVWPEVIAVDLSLGMLIRSAADCRRQADAARLPLADGCAAAVVIGDGPLFAAEAARVMADGAALVWSNALGDGAPFFVPTEILAAAMAAATGHAWDAVESQAHWGSWAVLRPAGRPQAGAGPAGEYAPRLPGPCTGTAGSKAAPRACRPADGGRAGPRGGPRAAGAGHPVARSPRAVRHRPGRAPIPQREREPVPTVGPGGGSGRRRAWSA